jgi:hypothetical protein
MKPPGTNGGMGATERAWLSWSVGLTAITGVAYFVMKDLMPRSDPFSVVGHPWQPHVLSAHVLIAPLLVFGLGLIARDHILGGVRNGGRRGNGRSGLITVFLAAPMVATGYLVQVVTGTGARRWIGLAHLGAGLLFAALFAAHIVAARRRRAAAQEHAVAGRGAPDPPRPQGQPGLPPA